MTDRSLTATELGIKEAKLALKRVQLNQTTLAEVRLGIARKTVSNFFTGKPVSDEIFFRICDALNLNWQVIAGIASPQPPNNGGFETELSDSAPPLLGAGGLRRIDAPANDKLNVLLLQPDTLDSRQVFELVARAIKSVSLSSIKSIDSLQNIYQDKPHIIEHAVTSSDLIIGNMDGGNASVTLGLDMAFHQGKPILLIAPAGSAMSVPEKFSRLRITLFSLGEPDYFIERFSTQLQLAVEGEYEEIIRQIEFSPEHREAGTSILIYFNRILQVKYPGVNLKVKIEQIGAKLRMIIVTPAGYREVIEHTFQEYGKVICGELSPEQLLSERSEILALYRKLEIIQMELSHTRDLLENANEDRIFLKGLITSITNVNK